MTTRKPPQSDDFITSALSGMTKWFKSKTKKLIAAIRGKNYKSSYEKRLIRGALKGKTRQQSRGHTTKEHIVRSNREQVVLGGLTSSQINSIKSFHSRFDLNGSKANPSLETLIDYAREQGYPKFVEYRKIWDAARKQYLRELNNGSYSSRGTEYLDMLAQQARLKSPGTVEWLYYH